MTRLIAVVLALAMAMVSGFTPMPAAPLRAVKLSASPAQEAAKIFAAAVAIGSIAGPALAITADERAQLSYLQVKGSGLANRCSTVSGSDSITVKSGAKLVDLCIEPKAFFVEEATANKKGDTKLEFVATKLMTRQTYTLDGISGSFKEEGGKLVFTEEDGIDYAPTTVQLPGGERVPFLFTVKELVAKGAANGNALKPGFEFGGPFKVRLFPSPQHHFGCFVPKLPSQQVPSYRTGLFLDPKGRGMATGYDQAQALPGLQSGVDGDAEMFNENNKVFDVLSGSIEFEIKNVNAASGEIDGVFVSAQPSDTDMGGKEPKKLLLKGSFFGKIE